MGIVSLDQDQTESPSQVAKKAKTQSGVQTSTQAAPATQRKSPDWIEKKPTETSDSSGGFLPEFVNQVGRFATGAWETVKAAAGVMDPFATATEEKEKLDKIWSGVKESTKAPIRELQGQPQPGEKWRGESAESNNPLEVVRRAGSAASVAFGGDPARARELEKQGDYFGAAAAYLTGPVLTYGAGRLLKVGERPVAEGEKIPASPESATYTYPNGEGPPTMKPGKTPESLAEKRPIAPGTPLKAVPGNIYEAKNGVQWMQDRNGLWSKRTSPDHPWEYGGDAAQKPSRPWNKVSGKVAPGRERSVEEQLSSGDMKLVKEGNRKTAELMTSVTTAPPGTSESPVNRIWERVAPHVQETIKLKGKAPLGMEDMVNSYDPATGKWTRGLIPETNTRLQNEYVKYKAPVANEAINGSTEIGDKIRARIRNAFTRAGGTLNVYEDEHGNFATGDGTWINNRPIAEGVWETPEGREVTYPQSRMDNKYKLVAKGTAEDGRKLMAESMKYDRDFTVDSADHQRQILYDAKRDAIRNPETKKTGVSLLADTIAEEALRDAVYDRVQAQAERMGITDPKYIRELKGAQSDLFSLEDALKPSFAKAEKASASKAGLPIGQSNEISIAASHSGKLGAAWHGLSKLIFGEASDMPEINRRVRKAFPRTTELPLNAREKAASAASSAVRGAAAGGTVLRKAAVVAGAGQTVYRPTVRMKAPDGSVRDVDAREVGKWQDAGAEVVE